MINLLPPARLTNLRIARSNTVLRRYVELTVLSVLFLMLAVFAAYYLLHVQQVNTQRTVDINQAKIKKLEPIQQQAEQLSLTVNTIAGLMSHNVKFSDTLVQIGKLMPDGSALTGLQFSIEDSKLPLVISAEVDSQQKAAILRNNLAGSAIFSRADIQSIIELKEKDDTSTTTPSSDTAAPTNTSTTTVSRYKYTTTINAYFKESTGVQK